MFSHEGLKVSSREHQDTGRKCDFRLGVAATEQEQLQTPRKSCLQKRVGMKGVALQSIYEFSPIWNQNTD